MTISLREGDRVALLVPPSEAYLDVVIGLLAAGVVPIPLDPRLTTVERMVEFVRDGPGHASVDDVEVMLTASALMCGFTVAP